MLKKQHPKLKLTKKELAKIKKEYKKHYKNFRKYKKYSQYSKVIINVLNGVTVSSVVLSFSGALPILILTICSSTLSSLTSIISETCEWTGKMYQSQTSYLQLKDLYQTYKIKSIGLNANYDEILNELNNKYGLISDSSMPVSLSSRESSRSDSN
jgi:hypothetical protein